jgi:hypothetical protein
MGKDKRFGVFCGLFPLRASRLLLRLSGWQTRGKKTKTCKGDAVAIIAGFCLFGCFDK